MRMTKQREDGRPQADTAAAPLVRAGLDYGGCAGAASGPAMIKLVLDHDSEDAWIAFSRQPKPQAPLKHASLRSLHNSRCASCWSWFSFARSQ